MSTMTVTTTRTLAPVLPLRPRAAAASGSGPLAEARVPHSSQVRLTRRGRMVVFLAALALVLGLFVLFGSGSVATRDAGTPPPTEIVQVTQGQTLWGIASERAANGGDIREVMSEIERLNALDSSMLRVGQKLRVPVAD